MKTRHTVRKAGTQRISTPLVNVTKYGKTLKVILHIEKLFFTSKIKKGVVLTYTSHNHEHSPKTEHIQKH